MLLPCRWRTRDKRRPMLTPPAMAGKARGSLVPGRVVRDGGNDLHLRHRQHHRRRDMPRGRCGGEKTHETLDNIAGAGVEENLCLHGLPGLGASLDSLAMARVYIKRPQDYPLVRAVCRERLGELPAIYVMADVCRGELLVEIEGIAFSRRM